MCATFSDDDVGKVVEDANGRSIGIVTGVDGDTARVETDPGLLDTMKAALGWGSDDEGTVRLDGSDIGEIGTHAIRLAADRSIGDDSGEGHDSVIEREEGGGRRDLGPASGAPEVDGEDDEALAGEGGADRHADNEDAPPEGDRTVTDERGSGQDR